MEIDTAKLNAQRAGSLATADAYYSARPYAVVVDGIETIAHTFKAWDDARAYLGDGMTNDDGDAFRIAKWDGECHRYRDGTRVKFSN